MKVDAIRSRTLANSTLELQLQLLDTKQVTVIFEFESCGLRLASLRHYRPDNFSSKMLTEQCIAVCDAEHSSPGPCRCQQRCGAWPVDVEVGDVHVEHEGVNEWDIETPDDPAILDVDEGVLLSSAFLMPCQCALVSAPPEWRM